MSEREGLAARLIKAFDARQRRRLGIYCFSDDPDCLFRVGLGESPCEVTLSSGEMLHKGDPVLLLHLWSDRVPRIPDGGATLAWAVRAQRMLGRSIKLLAEHVALSPALRSAKAIGNMTALPFTRGTVRMLQSTGLEVLDPIAPRTLYDRVAAWVRRVWTWLLRKAFNPASVQGRGPADFTARPVWISRDRLIALHYPPEEAGQTS